MSTYLSSGGAGGGDDEGGRSLTAGNQFDGNLACASSAPAAAACECNSGLPLSGGSPVGTDSAEGVSVFLGGANADGALRFHGRVRVIAWALLLLP